MPRGSWTLWRSVAASRVCGNNMETSSSVKVFGWLLLLMVLFSFTARAVPDAGIPGHLGRLLLLILMPPIALNHLYKKKNILITKASAALGVVYLGVFLFLAYALLYVRGILGGSPEFLVILILMIVVFVCFPMYLILTKFPHNKMRNARGGSNARPPVR